MPLFLYPAAAALFILQATSSAATINLDLASSSSAPFTTCHSTTASRSRCATFSATPGMATVSLPAALCLPGPGCPAYCLHLAFHVHRDNDERGLIYVDGVEIARPLFSDYPAGQYCGRDNADRVADLTLHVPDHSASTLTLRISSTLSSGTLWRCSVAENALVGGTSGRRPLTAHASPDGSRRRRVLCH